MDLTTCCIYREADHGLLLGMVRSLPCDSEIILMLTSPTTKISNDGLIEYIKDEDAGYGKLVKHYQYSYYCEDSADCWNGNKSNHFSFSKAKNACKQQATRSSILFLDADERLANWTEYNWDALLAIDNDMGAFLCSTFSYTEPCKAQPMGQAIITRSIKMFRNIDCFHYINEVHEQISDSVLAAGHTIAATNILINHFGYKSLESKDIDEKLKRNLYLLDKFLEREPFNLYAIEMRLKTLGMQQKRAESIEDMETKLEPEALQKIQDYKDGLERRQKMIESKND